MAKANGNKRGSARPGNAASGDTTGSGDSSSTGSGSAAGISADGGGVESQGGAVDNGTGNGEERSGDGAIIGAVGVGADGSAAGSPASGGDSNGTATSRGRGRPRKSPELVEGNPVIGEIPVPDISQGKLGRKRKPSKVNTQAAVELGLDAIFSLQKYRLGTGFEFWELQAAEKKDLAEKTVKCLDALPDGQASAVIQWLAKQAEMYGPFFALAWAGYNVVAPRWIMTQQLQAALAAERSKANGGTGANGHGQGAGVQPNSASGTGAPNGAGHPVPGETAFGAEGSGNGSGPTTAAFGSAGSLFAPPPHLTS